MFRPSTTPPTERPVVSRRRVLQGVGAAVATMGTGAGRSRSARSAPQRLTAAEPAAATLTVALNRALTDLDPHSAYDPGSGAALHGTFETLIRVEPGTTDRFEPWIARSWDTNDDKSLWTFSLEDGVTFQDATPCDADAVRLSFERLLALGFAPATVLGRFVQDAAQITAPNPSTVVFDLGRPQPLFGDAIASPYGASIVNAALARHHEVDGDWGHAWAQTTAEGMGTGPYQIVEVEYLNRAVLERYAEYWRGWAGPHFDSVILRVVPEAEIRRQLIENGEADIADNVSPEEIGALSTNSDLVVDLEYNLTVAFLSFAVTGPVQSPLVRQAICHAFPYVDVTDGVYNGYAKRAIGPCAELCRGFDPQTFRYDTDLDRARALLDQAGVDSGTKLTMLVPISSPWAGSIAELLRANLKQVGLELETFLADYATIVATYYGDMPIEDRPHLMPSFWAPDYNDGWNHLWPQVSSAAWQVGNAGHYANPDVDALLDQARDAADDETYRVALSRIQQIVTRDDPAAIYVSQPQWPVVLRNDIGGFVPNLLNGELYDFYSLHRRQS